MHAYTYRKNSISIRKKGQKQVDLFCYTSSSSFSGYQELEVNPEIANYIPELQFVVEEMKALIKSEADSYKDKLNQINAYGELF